MQIRENIKLISADMINLLKDFKLFTIKQGVTIFALMFISMLMMFVAFYIYFKQYGILIHTLISLFITIYLLVTKYTSPSYSKIIVCWFYCHMLNAIITITLLYGWDSGAGLYIIIIMSFNYFLTINNKRRVIMLVAAEMLFFMPFFYIQIQYFPHTYSEQERFFIDMLYILVCTSIIIGLVVCVSLYSIIVSNSIKKLESENEELSNKAKYDYLTKLLNRHTMESLITLENLQKRGVQSFALIIGDVDHFKKINDTYTHQVGDFVLKQVANNLKKSFREIDKVCRWGGEEFLVFCENITFDHISILLERTRKKIDSQQIIHEEYNIKVSMTFGAVFCNSLDNYNKASLIKQADKLLIKGKNSGRNRVIIQKV